MDATNEDALLKAGIMQARGIVPTVVDFAGIALMDRHPRLLMEEYRIADESPPAGKTPVKSNLRRDYGVVIVAIGKTGGEMIFNPMSREKIDENGILVMPGKKDDLERMDSEL
ncbi:MAG TPA: TrkA C-terminal domain-containing protein [Spirochaetota bacterium]|nr:TrkA C-terminal domain-containing protein [Spirochaetota bacterium]